MTNRNHVYKIHDAIVNFFRSQFDELRPDEEKDIRDGFISNCETVYIAGFVSAKHPLPEIVAAVQYSSSPAGTWINWLAVATIIPNQFKLEGGLPRNFDAQGWEPSSKF